MNKRIIGKVKFFKNNVRWGFITSEYNEEVFLHFTKLSDKTYVPQTGDTVEFSVEDSPRGKTAVEVVKI